MMFLLLISERWLNGMSFLLSDPRLYIIVVLIVYFSSDSCIFLASVILLLQVLTFLGSLDYTYIVRNPLSNVHTIFKFLLLSSSLFRSVTNLPSKWKKKKKKRNKNLDTSIFNFVHAINAYIFHSLILMLTTRLKPIKHKSLTNATSSKSKGKSK